MYNLLTVDDEGIERKAMSLLMEKLDIPVNVLEAGNGRHALEMLREHPVRIVITDIRMPVMDGLELSGMIAKEFPEVKIIIYSAFGEFDYARQAIRLGVSNYLLKPIQAEELKSVMEAVLAECEREDIRKANFGRLERISGELEDFKRQQMLEALLKPQDGEGLHEAAREWLLGQEAAFPLHLMLVKGRGGLRKIWGEISDIPCDCLELTDNECLLFVYPGKKLAESQLAALSERLRKKIWKTYSRHSFVVSGQAAHAPEDIAASYKMLDDAADYSFFMREGGAFLVRDGYFLHNDAAPLDESLLDCIYEDAEYRDLEKLKKDFHVFVMSIQNAAGLSHLYVKSIFSSLFGKLSGGGGLLSEQEGREILKEIARSRHIDELLAYVEARLESLGQGGAQAAEEGGRSVTTGVQMALKTIHQNYMNPLLSLESVAGRVYWSPGYLSVVFKRETGLSVSKYICRCRLEKAERLLLTTNVRVADIGTAVGFSSDSYFVSVFGAHYGQSPSKYRKNKGKAG
jgi:two-component system response regulator YesN